MGGPANQTGIQSLAYIEQFYADYRRDPDSVPPEWRDYFATAVNGSDGAVQIGPSFKSRSLFNPVAAGTGGQIPFQPDPRTENVSERLHQLIHNHRVRGHMIAAVNPLGATHPCPPELELDFYGFSESELDLL